MDIGIVVSVPALFSTKDVTDESYILEIFLEFFLFLFFFLVDDFSPFFYKEYFLSLQRFHTKN